MALPVLLWGAAAVLAATGIKKGMDATDDFDEAKRRGKRAEELHKKAVKHLEFVRNETNESLAELGKIKMAVFNNQIRFLVAEIKKTKHATSKLEGFEVTITTEELKEMERLVLASLEIEKGLGVGAATGALAAMGAYSGVGALAAASTGTAISSLSGVAATNATLAWLGGGSLAAGGFGVAGGTLALGGIVLGPALAVGGFMLASKAEEALTDATKYQAEVEIAVEKMKNAEVVFLGLQTHSAELGHALVELSNRFDAIRGDYRELPDGVFDKIKRSLNIQSAIDKHNAQIFEQLMVVGKGLKNLLDIALMDEEGQIATNIQAKISGCLVA